MGKRSTNPGVVQGAIKKRIGGQSKLRNAWKLRMPEEHVRNVYVSSKAEADVFYRLIEIKFRLNLHLLSYGYKPDFGEHERSL